MPRAADGAETGTGDYRMPNKLLAVVALGAGLVAAAPAFAGLNEPDSFLTEPVFAPQTLTTSSSGLPGAYEIVTFQSAGLSTTSFSEVNLTGKAAPAIFNTPVKVAEPFSIAMFASGMLALGMTRRFRRRR
jgi:hypothetical protein